MRLLIGFMMVFTGLMCLQTVRPNCSMTTMIGVEWLACLSQSHCAPYLSTRVVEDARQARSIR